MRLFSTTKQAAPLKSLLRDGAKRIANGPPIVGRAHAPMLEKYAGEYLIRRVPDLLGDLCNRKIRHLEKLAGFFQSQSRQVDSRRHADALLEHACEMKE